MQVLRQSTRSAGRASASGRPAAAAAPNSPLACSSSTRSEGRARMAAWRSGHRRAGPRRRRLRCLSAGSSTPARWRTSCPEHSCSTRLFSVPHPRSPEYRLASATDPNTSAPAASTAAASAAASAAATAMSGLPPAAAAAAPAAAAVAATIAAGGPPLLPPPMWPAPPPPPPPPAVSLSLAPGQAATAGDAECNSSCSRLGERLTTCSTSRRCPRSLQCTSTKRRRPGRIGSTCHCPFHSTGHTHSCVSCFEQPARHDSEALLIFLLSSLCRTPSRRLVRLGNTVVRGLRMNLMRAAVRLVREGNTGPTACFMNSESMYRCCR
mmetsp:Transcript_9050/g.22926  ORF Transcript_9050/g.22926 Transcript_9050/m.22926 type:complete len:323 (-) Transcript_9050:641-1609(-)